MLLQDYQWHYGPGDAKDIAGCEPPVPSAGAAAVAAAVASF
jgi:hypothetical protein